MLVINRGLSGKWHVFRGTEAQTFMSRLDVAGSQKCVVALPKGRFEKALFCLTKANTGLLIFNSETVDVALAKIAYLQVWKKLSKQLRRAHGSA
jgi:hypothetical protein